MNALPEQCGIWDTMSVRQRFGIFYRSRFGKDVAAFAGDPQLFRFVPDIQPIGAGACVNYEIKPLISLQIRQRPDFCNLLRQRSQRSFPAGIAGSAIPDLLFGEADFLLLMIGFTGAFG